MPLAAVLRDPPLYLITPDLSCDRALELEAGLAAVCASREARRLQWRLPRWPRAAALELLGTWLPRLRAARVDVLLNGNPDEACALGCGLHLRASLLAGCDVESLANLQRVSASCHDASELARAAALGVGVALLGPVAATATHPGAAALGWPGFSALRAGSALPIYALGGLGAADLAEARRHGAQGVAAIRGLWPHPV
jgi:8-oxo-dGTP diphosphatase